MEKYISTLSCLEKESLRSNKRKEPTFREVLPPSSGLFKHICSRLDKLVIL